jgi:hypothetical protein
MSLRRDRPIPATTSPNIECQKERGGGEFARAFTFRRSWRSGRLAPRSGRPRPKALPIVSASILHAPLSVAAIAFAPDGKDQISVLEIKNLHQMDTYIYIYRCMQYS